MNPEPSTLNPQPQPLRGRRIMVTRAQEQQGDFTQLLESYGAEVIKCPTISLVPPANWRPLDQVLDRIGNYHWVIFTSANGVRFFLGRLRETGRQPQVLDGVKIATIGPATAAALQEVGVNPDLVPGEYRAEAILDVLDGDLRGVRFLIPRAAEAREVLPAGLRERGAVVEVVPVYRTVRATDEARTLPALLRAGQIDAVTFTSSSTVVNFAEMCPEEDLPVLLTGVTIACIGPVTAETAGRYGLAVDVIPSAFTIPDLAEALVTHLVHRTPPAR